MRPDLSDPTLRALGAPYAPISGPKALGALCAPIAYNELSCPMPLRAQRPCRSLKISCARDVLYLPCVITFIDNLTSRKPNPRTGTLPSQVERIFGYSTPRAHCAPTHDLSKKGLISSPRQALRACTRASSSLKTPLSEWLSLTIIVTTVRKTRTLNHETAHVRCTIRPKGSPREWSVKSYSLTT